MAIVTGNCRLCGAGTVLAFAARDYLSGDKFAVNSCIRCRTTVTEPMPGNDQLARYYEGLYYNSRKVRVDNYINTYRRRLISKIKKRGKLLDIGCGNGNFIGQMDKYGFDVRGVEMAPSGHIRNQEIFKRISFGTFLDLPFEQGGFDIITLWHVFEHLPSPREHLKKIHSILKSEGLLVLEVPNISSIQGSLTKADWFNLDVPRHLYHYNVSTLSKLLNEEGFRVNKVLQYSPIYSYFGFGQSLINIITKRKNILFDVLNRKITYANRREHGVSTSDFLLNMMLTPIAFFLAIPLTIIESAIQRGGIITIIACKR